MKRQNLCNVCERIQWRKIKISKESIFVKGNIILHEWPVHSMNDEGNFDIFYQWWRSEEKACNENRNENKNEEKREGNFGSEAMAIIERKSWLKISVWNITRKPLVNIQSQESQVTSYNNIMIPWKEINVMPWKRSQRTGKPIRQRPINNRRKYACSRINGLKNAYRKYE